MPNMQNASRALRGIFLCTLAALAHGEALAESEGDKLLEKGLSLVRKGAHEKAIQVLTRANAKAGGQSLSALHGLSAAHNGLEEYGRAYALAKEVLGASEDAGLRAATAIELVHAVALGEVEAENAELEHALSEVRRYLAQEPATSLSDGLRQRLCSIRRQAGLPRPGASSPLEIGEGVEKPIGLHTPQPVPDSSKHRPLARKESVRIRTLIDMDGCVDSIDILNTTSKAWGEIAVEQAAQWVFRPANRDGSAVAAYYPLTIDRRAAARM